MTEEEMGEALFEVSTATVNTLEALERSHGEARRRVGVLVCGLFFKLREPGGKGGGGTARGGKGKRGRRREGKGVGFRFEPGKARGEARREEIRAVLERVERVEVGGATCISLLGGWVSAVPVPAWSTRALGPGEWREVEPPRVEQHMRVEKVRLGSRETRTQRLREVAELGAELCTSGSNRMYTIKYKCRRRVEDGADVSGVT